MKDYQDMKRSGVGFGGNAPLEREIDLFKKKREQADMIEKIFRGIQTKYNSTDIGRMKTSFEKRYSQDFNVYNHVAASNYYNKLKSDLSQKATQLPEFSQNLIVNTFTIDDPPVVRLPSETLTKHNPNTLHPSTAPPTPSSKLEPISLSSYLENATKGSQRSLPQQSEVRPQYSNQLGSQKDIRIEPQYQQTITGPTKPENYHQSIKQGNPPLAKLSSERNEVQITYDLKDPQLSLQKNFSLGKYVGRPTTIRSIDDRNLVIGFEDGTMKVLDILDSNVARQFKLSSKIVCVEPLELAAGYNPSMTVLCGTGSPENCIIKIDLRLKELEAIKYRGHKDEISGISVLSAGDFVSCGHDGCVILWNNASNEPLKVIKAHEGKVNSMCTLNSNQTIVTGSSDCSMKIFHLKNKELVLVNTLVEKRPVETVCSFYGNCKFAFSCLQGGTIRIWNVEDAE